MTHRRIARADMSIPSYVSPEASDLIKKVSIGIRGIRKLTLTRSHSFWFSTQRREFRLSRFSNIPGFSNTAPRETEMSNVLHDSVVIFFLGTMARGVSLLDNDCRYVHAGVGCLCVHLSEACSKQASRKLFSPLSLQRTGYQ